MSSVKSAVARALGRSDPNRPVRDARIWSNRFIAAIAPFATARVVNVSAWKDEDKEGRTYRDYFTAAKSYETTNFEGWRGADVPSDHNLDLQQPAPEHLAGAFDLVFNHTTLEHVYDFHRAFDTLAELTGNAMLLIVPWIQPLHGPVDGDFWRFSPFAMRRLFADRGFTVVAEQAGPVGGKVRYLGHLAARDPDYWRERLQGLSNDVDGVTRQPL